MSSREDSSQMAGNGGTFRNLLIWTYERGTLQYDIICALILAFIFLVPRSCFVSTRSEARVVPVHSGQGTAPAPAPGDVSSPAR